MTQLSSSRSGGEGPVRPGSMTAVMRAIAPRADGPMWLRYALVADGRIVSEQVRGPERPITVGAHPEADVHVAELAGRQVLFEHRHDGWTLRVAPGWRGRLNGRSLEDFEAPVRDGWRELRLGQDARAKIDLGSVSLLVQLVHRPAARTKPQLPASLTGGLMERADWWFTAFVTGSFLVHFALVAFLFESDWPVDQALIPPRVAELIFEAPEPPPDVPDEMTTSEGDEVADASDETTDPSDAPSDDARPERPRTADASRPSRESGSDGQPTLADDAVRDAVQAQLLTLGAIGGANGSAFDALRDGPPTENSADIFAAVDGAAPVAGNETGRLTERDRSVPGSGPDGRGIGALNRRDGGDRQRGEGEPLIETVVRRPTVGLLPPEDPPLPSPGFDPAELHRALRGRMTAIRRCYERELTQGNPDLGGRLTVSMRVMPVGILASVHIADDTTGSESLGACAVRSVASVRLRQGPESPVDVEYPIVFSRQQ